MPNENEVFQHGCNAQTRAQRQPLGTLADSDAGTPVPSTGAAPEYTPGEPVLRHPRRPEVCMDELCQGTKRLGLEDKASPEVALRPRGPSSSGAAPGSICPAALALQHSSAALPAAPSIASEVPTVPAAKRVRGLPQLDLWAGEMQVKNGFIDFSSPRERTPTSQLTGHSAPPGGCHGTEDAQELLTEPRSWEPETPLVLSLQNLMQEAPPMEAASSTDAVPQRGFQLNLSVWLKREEPVAARAIAAPEPPRQVRLADFLDHLMPARTAAAAAAGGGEPVVRQLFPHASDPN